MSPGTVIVGIPDPIPLLPGIHGGMGIGMDGLVILDLLDAQGVMQTLLKAQVSIHQISILSLS